MNNNFSDAINGELTKESLLGVKTLLKGIKAFGKGTAKGVQGKAKSLQAKFIKSRVGAQTGVKGVTSTQAGKVTYSTDRIGRITGKVTHNPKQITQLQKAEKLEGQAQTLATRGKQIRSGTKKTMQRAWQKEKAGDKAWLAGAQKKRRLNKKVKAQQFQAEQSAAIKGLEQAKVKPPKQIPKIEPKVDPKATNEGFVSTVGARLVGEKSKYKKVIGGTALGGGGLLASNALGGSNKKAPEQGIFFKSSKLNTTASIGGAVLASQVKQANKNVSGSANSNINSTTKAPPTIKTHAPKNAFPKVKPIGKKIAALVGEFEKDSSVALHAGRLLRSVGKAVGKAVKGGTRANPKAQELLHRGNIGAALLKNPQVTGAATVAAGAYGTKRILEDKK
jgi:hypothetical protein